MAETTQGVLSNAWGHVHARGAGFVVARRCFFAPVVPGEKVKVAKGGGDEEDFISGLRHQGSLEC